MLSTRNLRAIMTFSLPGVAANFRFGSWMFWREHKLSAIASQPHPGGHCSFSITPSSPGSQIEACTLSSSASKPRFPTPPAYRQAAKSPRDPELRASSEHHSSLASSTNLTTLIQESNTTVEVPTHFTYITMSSDGPLFSSDLISPEVLKALPEGYSCRPLERKDYHNGFLDVLRVLTTVGDITEEVRHSPSPPSSSHLVLHTSPAIAPSSNTIANALQQWNERYTWMSTRNDSYFLLCITDSSQSIVGTGALIVERKFIHQLGLVGHIEDIAVAKDQQGKKLGLRIIQALDFVAERVGCYKVRLRDGTGMGMGMGRRGIWACAN
jgi:glucosamine-phosphate N-acetyltransferase